MKKKLLFICLLLVSLLATSCGYSTEYQVFDSMVESVRNSEGSIVSVFNTSVSLRTFCEKDKEEIFPLFQDRIQKLHKQYDRYNDYLDDNGQKINNLKVINESYGTNEEIVISQDLFGLLEQCLEMATLTQGYFNPTIANVSHVWTYYENEYGQEQERFSPYCFEEEDPLHEDILSALESVVPYQDLDDVIVLNKDNSSVTFKKYKDVENITLSLGAIAKGYAVELVKKELEVFNVPLMINAGSSSSYGVGINPNPERNYWVVGMAAPYKTILSVPAIATVRFNNTYTLSMSGDYENCFKSKSEGVIRHHIINPFTGYPENYIRVLSLWSATNSGVLDGLSTALFSMSDSDTMLEVLKAVEEYYSMDIELFYEVEVDAENKKVDIYLTGDYQNAILQYNTKYYNQEHLLTKKG